MKKVNTNAVVCHNSCVEVGTKVVSILPWFLGKGHSAIAVTKNKKVVGLVTRKDLLYQMFVYKINDETTIEEIMQENPVTGKEGMKPSKIVQVMRLKNIRHLPLTKNGKFSSMVRAESVNRLVAEETSSDNDNLKKYLMGDTLYGGVKTQT